MDEVQRPPLVHCVNCNGWVPATEGNSSAHALPHLQIGLAIDPQDPLDVDDHPVATQQHRKPSEAEAPSLSCKFFKSSTQPGIVLSNPNVTNHAAINPQIPARLAFTDVELIPSRLHDSTFLSRR